MRITARMSSARLETEMSRAGRKVAKLKELLPDQPRLSGEYHSAYATWHQCNALLAARRGDKDGDLGSMQWHQARAAKYLTLAGGEA